jgi:hypothetical protein
MLGMLKLFGDSFCIPGIPGIVGELPSSVWGAKRVTKKKIVDTKKRLSCQIKR